MNAHIKLHLHRGEHNESCPKVHRKVQGILMLPYEEITPGYYWARFEQANEYVACFEPVRVFPKYSKDDLRVNCIDIEGDYNLTTWKFHSRIKSPEAEHAK